MLKHPGRKNSPAYSFYAWLTYYKIQVEAFKNWLRINRIKGFLLLVMLSFSCEYSFLSIFVLNDPLFSELLPAHCANILSPGLLDSSHFIAIENTMKSRADLIGSYVELAENQYSNNFTASDASCFCYNLHDLLYQVLSQSSIIGLIRLQWEISVMPLFAPALDLLGAFDNSPKIEYSGLSYSEFIFRGVVNTLVVIRSNGNPGDLPVYELNIAINFLRNTIHRILDLNSIPNSDHSVLILGAGMLDLEFFARERAGRFDPVTTPLTLLRLLFLLYVIRYLYNKFVKKITLKVALRWMAWAFICWILLYISSLVVYSLPPDMPFIFHFMNFPRILSYFDCPTHPEEFAFYLDRSIGVSRMLELIRDYKIGYQRYLDRGVVNLAYLDASVDTLSVLWWCLLGFFDIKAWFLLTKKLFFALPVFCLVPEDCLPFKSPEVGVSYSVYIIKNLMSWQARYLRELKRQWTQEIIELPDEIAANVDQQLVEFFLYLLDEFSFVLAT